jgi:hypothetical protein
MFLEESQDCPQRLRSVVPLRLKKYRTLELPELFLVIQRLRAIVYHQLNFTGCFPESSLDRIPGTYMGLGR